MLKELFRKLKSSRANNLPNSFSNNGLNVALLASGDGQRQAAPNLKGIRPDHVARYELAARFIPENGVVLDMACGVGYGAYILARKARIL